MMTFLLLGRGGYVCGLSGPHVPIGFEYSRACLEKPVESGGMIGPPSRSRYGGQAKKRECTR